MKKTKKRVEKKRRQYENDDEKEDGLKVKKNRGRCRKR